MTDRQADPRSLNFAGDVDEQGWPLPMTVENLRARSEKWPVSPHTPENVAAHLARARQLFVDGYYTYENFVDAATRSLQAVEVALRVRFDATESSTLFKLIEQAHAEQLVDDEAREILHTGRKLRNIQIHSVNQSVYPPAVSATIIRTSHKLVAEIFFEVLA